VLLLCDLNVARRIMSEATRLKMTGGHFIWLWADTSSTAEFFQTSDIGSGDDKTSYDDFMGRKQSGRQQFYQQPASNRRNQTRFKSANSNRFHHIVGLKKPGEDNFMGLPPAQSGFLKGDKSREPPQPPTGQIPSRDKRRDQKRVNPSKKVAKTGEQGDDEANSRRLNIKNINSNEFNANYYDPYSPAYRQNLDDSDFDDSTSVDEANAYYDYDKSNPFSGGATAAPGKKSAVAQQAGSDDELDLDNYSEATNDSKAKRADNFHTFNISSHVFFHHFKDFPVGLLALRHIKMNVDRVFVRSAIRLFASTWARVEKNEEIRAAMSTASSGRVSSGKAASFDYDEYGDMFRITNNNKIKSKANVNNRYSNAPVRGSRKFKREAGARSILPSVNSSDKTINFTLKNESGLNITHNMHPSVVEIQSNIDTISRSVGVKTLNVNSSASSEGVEHGASGGGGGEKKEVRKRQQWWTSSTKSANVRNQQEKVKIVGTLQYKGGCFGTLARADLKRSEIFAK
jgi:hypothetical protein